MVERVAFVRRKPRDWERKTPFYLLGESAPFASALGAVLHKEIGTRPNFLAKLTLSTRSIFENKCDTVGQVKEHRFDVYQPQDVRKLFKRRKCGQTFRFFWCDDFIIYVNGNVKRDVNPTIPYNIPNNEPPEEKKQAKKIE